MIGRSQVWGLAMLTQASLESIRKANPQIKDLLWVVAVDLK